MGTLLKRIDTYLLQIGVSLILFFIPLYPKVPSIHITHTWVYIRLEDFLIAAVVFIWLVQLLRRKVSLPPLSLSLPFIVYWICGFISLLYALLYISHTIIGFFPHVAILSYLRRIEYMVLFFVGFASIRKPADLLFYVKTLFVTVFCIVVYGLGQRYYLLLWQKFPQFFEHNSFCFPSFQTGNEEFAKGIPLCLPFDARITSTFGGHYDLAAYLVFIIPIIVGVFLYITQRKYRVITGILYILSTAILVLTASRISFVASLIGTIAMLIFLKRKKFIIPVTLISVVLLLTFSGSTAKRFSQTFQYVSIVTNSQGQVVGEVPQALPASLQKKIAKNPVIIDNEVPTQNLQRGSSLIQLPSRQAPVATSVAIVKQDLSQANAKRLKLDYGGVQISTVEGSFLIRKALVYDISFTTRFQGEWPHAWAAFLVNPFIGSGFSTITLAADNDYLRALGESGLLGLGSFIFIFIIFAFVVQASVSKLPSTYAKGFIFGLMGGLIGLSINATLIDVFEASKVAEIVWPLLGLGMGTIIAIHPQSSHIWKKLVNILTSHFMLILLLLIAGSCVLMPTVSNFFVADDFVWLHWAATANMDTIKTYFLDAQHFFYRPIDKMVVFFLYTLFSFQPEPYHMFSVLIHLLIVIGVYILTFTLFKKKLLAFVGSSIYLLMPIHGEDIFWFATISTNLSTLFVLYMVLLFIRFRQKGFIGSYIASVILGLLALFSYEMAAMFPLLLLLVDLFITKVSFKSKKVLLTYIPFILSVVVYWICRVQAHAAGFSGDYSYNIFHFIPNFFGNLFGYFGMFLFGEQAYPFYAHLRANLKVYGVGILLGLVFFCLVLSVVVYIKRKNIMQMFRNDIVRYVLFSLLFSIVALLPFIGLGNISERYGYLASIGFVLGITTLLYWLSRKVDRNIYLGIVAVVVVLLTSMNYAKLMHQQALWQESGYITKHTLAFFRLKYPIIPQASSIYIIDLPIKKENVWVFPVGFEDGLWFIYRDPSIQVKRVSSVDEATKLQAQSAPIVGAMNYIFTFDQVGNISFVK